LNMGQNVRHVSAPHFFGMDDSLSLSSSSWSGWLIRLTGRLTGVQFQQERDRFFGSTSPPIQRVPEVLFPIAKRPELEADNSPSSSAKVKNAWSYTSKPAASLGSYRFLGWTQGFIFLQTLVVVYLLATVTSMEVHS
jgi:hypothetical protein